jgi:hypothetical protein
MGVVKSMGSVHTFPALLVCMYSYCSTCSTPRNQGLCSKMHLDQSTSKVHHKVLFLGTSADN